MLGILFAHALRVLILFSHITEICCRAASGGLNVRADGSIKLGAIGRICQMIRMFLGYAVKAPPPYGVHVAFIFFETAHLLPQQLMLVRRVQILS